MSRPVDDLIFDRTQADVTNQTLKGEYRAEDLNRVESWCRYLTDELNSVGYDITITTKTDWTKADLRTQLAMSRIRTNIKKIMDGYYYITNIASNTQKWDWIKANNWEQILNEINDMMDGMRAYYVYGGMAYGGEPREWQNFFMQ